MIFLSSVQVLDWPFFRESWKSCLPLLSMAWIQLVPPAAVTFTVTLPGGAAAMALLEGCGGLGSPLPWGFWVGVAEVVVAVGLGAALELPSPPLPLTAV